ncbi:L-histidine N(alpha)-methyltransferase [Lacisediminimonas sp.]|uniref:L-histidine N(alpha)-methyltransferase n=1 Tax=Lacisediminimonas sp. TaxID=3060582 RepID=UPI00271D97DD|nr:L-histidine N(alpha)-methyltransferase [Lacisediminimonas sp.]MDO8300010.1 L-histidine N(alpha)-methyltransferase [Lacisediminimonas sp.]
MARFIQIAVQDAAAIRDELTAGLSAPTAAIAPKHFYDLLGSKLFEAICELPEYYPTRTEAAIFADQQAAIGQAAGSGRVLIDLGAGNCEKAASLFPVLQPSAYVPVDISTSFLQQAVERLQAQYPAMPMLGVGIDFSTTLELPPEVPSGRRLFFYPGSSIGNFTPQEAVAFLRRVCHACGSDGSLLIGVDLVKDPATLQQAYDDALGVTACFNLNVLNNVNALLHADFRLSGWRHQALFNAVDSRIEMHLEAREDQRVGWDGGARRFERGQRIHTENSYKYSRAAFLALLQEAGFAGIEAWTDPQQWFMVCHARVG